MELWKKKYWKKKSDIRTINLRCKNEIKNSFQVIRIRLNEKEREIKEKMESTLKDNLNELNDQKMASTKNLHDPIFISLLKFVIIKYII